MKMRTALARALAEEYEVSTIFGLLGGGNMLFVDDFVHRFGGSFIKVTREDAAVLGALGYGHASGELGVATVSQGPGFTNAVTALTEGVRNRTPLLVVAGDTAALDRTNLQNIDHRPFAEATGAEFVEVDGPETLLGDLAHAIERAFVSRGTVVLNIHSNFNEQEVEYERHVVPRIDSQRTPPDPDTLSEALGVIASARRPLVLAGFGAVVSDARDELLQLAERIGAPVATTLKAKGFFRGSPFDLGVFGTMSSSLAGEVFGQVDTIIAFGASLNTYTAGHGPMLEGKSVVQVDAFHGNIGMTFPATVGVLGDARTVARSMVEWLDEGEIPQANFRSDALRERIASYDPTDEFDDLTGDGTVDMRAFTVELNKLLPEDRNIVTDGGRFVVAPMRYFDPPDPRSWFASLSFGSFGLALGSAIGVATAEPDAPTVLVVGDGSLMASINELNTPVRHDLDLIVVLFNDGSYGTEYYQLLQRSDSPEEGIDLSLFDWPDFAAVADAFGLQSMTVRSLDDLEQVTKAIADRDRPLLLDVRVAPEKRVGFMD